MQDPAGAEDVVLLEVTLDVLLVVIDDDLLVETELEDDPTLDVDDLDVDEATLEDDLMVLVVKDEVFDVEEIMLLELLDWTLAQTNCVWPISHAPLMLKDSKTMALMAFRFAPVNALSSTVYVWVAPVTPVKLVK